MWESIENLDYNYGENACPGPQPKFSGWDCGQDGMAWEYYMSALSCYIIIPL